MRTLILFVVLLVGCADELTAPGTQVVQTGKNPPIRAPHYGQTDTSAVGLH